MFKIRVEAAFCAAHFLRDYCGKCENLHGHNYKVFAYMKGRFLDSGGMLFDFSKLKTALREICKALDHTNLNEKKDENGKDIFLQNPSAERIAKFIFDSLVDLFQKQGIDISKPSIDEAKNNADNEIDNAVATNHINNSKDEEGTQDTKKEHPYLFRVDVFETPQSRASYSIE